ncbi:PREDICTED: uncharacterized protein LOC108619985 [Drosophila arizonae]|uniref:Uncharacterized protein LOC108619985 n=1 Tax=Drosophila arizonae TaxID=7263 RepID=A0ABM1PYN3_DROAR|nr:PREDICTED: uncharacterized protein LOC108619985 [Drosophila arizonae]
MSEQRSTKPRGSSPSNRCRSSGLIFTSLWLMLLLQLATETEGYRAIIPIDEANPGKCIYRGDLLPEGINNGIPPCQRLTCNADGSILIEGCGKLRIDKCNRGERIYPSKPFPECCLLRYKCKRPDGVPFYIERNAAEGA